MCGGSKNGATFLVQFRDSPSEGFWLREVKVGFFCHQRSFATAS